MSEYLWKPNANCETQLDSFIKELNQQYQLTINSYETLYEWSIENVELFWQAVAIFTGLCFSKSSDSVLQNKEDMINAKWFPGSKLNYAENCLKKRDDSVAIISLSEENESQSTTYAELYVRVAKLASYLKSIGIQKGDRVVGIVANSSEAIISFLAVSSLGAIWSSCSPDFGENGILDRFSQINPKCLISVNGYKYSGKIFDISEKIKAIQNKIDTCNHLILIPFSKQANAVVSLENVMSWESIQMRPDTEIEFEQVDFDHPLVVLYSSGTTGIPKSIVHSVGGTLIQHLKEHQLHSNISERSVLFYYTTCGWMMWNWLVSGLATGATLICFDGSPFSPNKYSCWKMIDTFNITHFGTSAKFIQASQKLRLSPKEKLSLESLKVIFSTGSPLLEENFEYIYEQVKADVQLASISGGTDIVSCFALGCPILPVYKGELQCRGLGMAVQAFNDKAQAVYDERGELVCTKPFPSMPVGFWNDENKEKYKNAYFNKFEGIWCHGDYLEINSRGGVKILGRSDATLNPGGVRIGTAEIYRVVESLDEIKDSLVIGKKVEDDEEIVLFVVLTEGAELNDALIHSIKLNLRTKCSPRHVPKKIIEVNDIPYTKSGKKVEMVIKEWFNTGNMTIQKSSLQNAECLESYQALTI